MRIPPFRLLIVLLTLTIAACGGSGGEERQPVSSGAAGTPAESSASADKNAYPVFPNADAGADASVPAEQGGRGFAGEGWQTNTTYDLIGDPRAKKGETLRHSVLRDFPSTLRYAGPNVTAWNAMLHGLAYESLLGLHPTTLDYIPALATHWQISTDKRTFRFRIDPNARWSDGKPVVSEDVVASWTLFVDKTLQDPARMQMFSNFEPPVAESRYLVSVKAKSENWQNFLYFSGMFIYPAHVLKNINGEAYLRDYNYKMLPGTGPYMVSEQDVDKGKMIRIRRRPDYWAMNQRRNVGTANFDVLQQIVVRDENLEYEMFKKGDLDYFVVSRAQMWVEELNYANIKRGLIQKRKVFNHNPSGVTGVAMNTRREPYNDIRVRKALRHLFNRELMVEKMMFNEYLLMDSMFPGSVYQNPNNEKVRYDPQKALQLLAEAGWKDRNSAGRLTKNDQPLNIEIVYATQGFERYFTIFQEDLRKIGITLNLRFVTFETLVKLLDERTFGMAHIGYTGEVFPSPEANWRSDLADQKNTNNITGFKNKRADEIIALYEKEFSFNKRVTLLQEFDGIITNEHSWILTWSAPYERYLYWNKFGQPKGIITRIGDLRDIPSMWWIDPVQARRLNDALKDPGMQLGEGPSDDRYWLEFAKLEAQGNPVTQ